MVTNADPISRDDQQYSYPRGDGWSPTSGVGSLDPLTPRDIEALMVEIPAAIRQIKKYLWDGNFNEQEIDAILQLIADKIAGGGSEVQIGDIMYVPWTAKEWLEGSIVLKDGLVYVALVTTSQVPGTGSDWILIAAVQPSTGSFKKTTKTLGPYPYQINGSYLNATPWNITNPYWWYWWKRAYNHNPSNNPVGPIPQNQVLATYKTPPAPIDLSSIRYFKATVQNPSTEPGVDANWQSQWTELTETQALQPGNQTSLNAAGNPAMSQVDYGAPNYIVVFPIIPKQTGATAYVTTAGGEYMMHAQPLFPISPIAAGSNTYYSHFLSTIYNFFGTTTVTTAIPLYVL